MQPNESEGRKNLREYLASDPPNAVSLIYRIVLLAVIGAIVVLLSAIRHGQSLNTFQIRQVATAVATVQHTLDETPAP